MTALSLSDPAGLAIMFLGLFLGAMLKGATGAGLPVIAIPSIAAIYDVRVAVVLLVIPNFITNIWQIKKYYKQNLDNNFARNFALAGIAGAGAGTLLLAYLPLVFLNIVIIMVVLFYVLLKLRQPDFHLPMHLMQKWQWIAGTCAGVLQGAVGLSAPITITFLHSGSFPRPSFIFIASLFFAGMCLIQLPLQSALGLMTWEIALLSFASLIPIMLGLPIGELLGKNISAKVFDHIILILLTTIAIKMLIDTVLHFA